jgi:hypothetical protein
MTEQEWLECGDPQKMLGFLRGKARDRKLRLFACACCRQVWHLLPDEKVRGAVEAAERFADGLADAQELEAARLAALRFCRRGGGAPYAAMECAECAETEGDMLWSAGATAAYAAKAASKSRRRGPPPGWVAEYGLPAGLYARSAGMARKAIDATHATILRCIFGNPSRAERVDPMWVTRTVARLAAGIYQDRAFDHLLILADALEDAGCDDAAILGHLRGPGPHVRGCWAVDLLLGKT